MATRSMLRRTQLTAALIAASLVTVLMVLTGGALAATADPSVGDTSGALVADCEPLVAFTPTGADGDFRAVSITSQVLEAGQPGWVRISWQAADDTLVTRVEISHTASTTVLTDGDLSTGVAEDVAKITFCGTQG